MSNEPLQFGVYYHIYNRGNNRESLFPQERNYPYFLKLYAKYILPVAATYAYVLMPNHFHLLIRTRTTEEQEEYFRAHQIGSVLETEPISEAKFKLIEPSRAFNNLFIAYAKAINKATGRTGVLFETPFHRKPITDHPYFQRLIAYIHQNPQKHGFVEDYRNWTWSSYGATLGEKTTHLERDETLAFFGSSEQFLTAHRFHSELDDEDGFSLGD